MKHLFSLTLLFGSVTAFADGAPQTLYRGMEFKDSKHTPAAASCGLKRFTQSTADVEFLNMFGSMPATRQTTMASVTEVSDPSCLRNYGVVNFIRGCMYSTRTDLATGEQVKTLMIRDLRGKEAPFKHLDWEVDTIDEDPLYNSYSGPNPTPEKRLDWQQTAKRPLVLKTDSPSMMKDYLTFFTEKHFSFLFKSPVPLKQIFLTDTPSGSTYNPDAGANNSEVETSSLEFMTCIYHIKDIPMTGSPAGFDVPVEEGGPIKCHAWSDKSAFNSETKRFDRTEEIDPFCQ